MFFELCEPRLRGFFPRRSRLLLSTRVVQAAFRCRRLCVVRGHQSIILFWQVASCGSSSSLFLLRTENRWKNKILIHHSWEYSTVDKTRVDDTRRILYSTTDSQLYVLYQVDYPTRYYRTLHNRVYCTPAMTKDHHLGKKTYSSSSTQNWEKSNKKIIIALARSTCRMVDSTRFDERSRLEQRPSPVQTCAVQYRNKVKYCRFLYVWTAVRDRRWFFVV